MEQFRIEVQDNGQAIFYGIKPLGNARYQIYVEEETIGTIQLDEKNHAHCESVGCELDMPLLNAIRDEIQLHEKWKNQR
jgi:hypothetical protein